MDPLFHIDDSRRDDVTYVALTGEIDLAAAPVIRDHVDRLLGTDTAAVVIDLSGVTFLDSSGIGTLLTCRKMADAAGKTFRALHAQDRVAAILDMTGVTDILAGT
jgi:anti-sigma B factor antagonist